VTNAVRSGIGLTRLIGLDRTDSVFLRQDRCLANRNEGRARKTDANLKKMMAEIRAYSKMFEILLGTLVSWMDIHQART
jgi:hypothetical protein